TLGFGERRKEEKGEEEARFVKIVEFSLWNSSGVIPTRFLDNLIHVSGCNFKLNLLYIEGINDSKYLGKEPFKFRGFRGEKRKRKVVKHLGKGVGRRASQRTPKQPLNVGLRGDAPARAPQLAL
ncbi:hypothetical protein MTR67_027192, partial [Solanum verrucosum]